MPWLILGATLLLAFQEMITRHVRIRGGPIFVFTLQFIVSIYGGYFGAGMGILMLAALGFIGLTDLHQMNGLKNLLAICINGVAAIYFAVSGAVIWSDAILMAIAASWLVNHYLALKKAEVSAELHVYANTPHGFGYREGKNSRPVDAWPERFQEFLKAEGMLKKD